MLNLTAYVWGVDAPKEMAAGGNDTTTATTANRNTSTAILPPQADDAKAIASVGARAALLGHTFHRHGNLFVIGRWGYSREFDSLVEAAQWLDQMGGAK